MKQEKKPVHHHEEVKYSEPAKIDSLLDKKLPKMKKRLTQTEEFEIMKLVLDKFLWLGFGIMAFGLYKIAETGTSAGFTYIVIGAVLLLLFIALIVREYEIVK